MFNRFHIFIRASFVTGLIVLLGNLSGCASDAEIAAASGEQAGVPAAAGADSETQGASATGIAIDSRWAGRPIAEI